ncbi:MAG: hypothetical protein QM751_07265, partial [Paludibacteraceae bacterium]
LVAVPGLKANTPITLSFELEGDLLPYRYYDNAWEGWTPGSGAWFPMPLDDAGRVYTVHAQVRAPKNFPPHDGWGDPQEGPGGGDLPARDAS